MQRIVRERFGARGRALGLAPGIPSEGFSAATDAQKAADQLLADVYVYLVKECNKVTTLDNTTYPSITDSVTDELFDSHILLSHY